ncbi:MAG TPA: hypothetical protein VEC12_12345 [Bacteroidia bacterium]|nr:hypothetical protein [Bacteroidia bacterium]
MNFEDPEMGCPVRTQGIGFFTGDVNFSLIDTENQAIINAVNFGYYFIPFLFESGNYSGSGSYYTSIPLGYSGLKKVEVLKLFDANGDDKRFEFCLYLQEGCGWTNKSMFNYDPESDSIYNYPVNVELNEYDTLGKLDTVYRYVTEWVYIDFIYPAGKRIKFNMARYMIRGAPIASI